MSFSKKDCLDIQYDSGRRSVVKIDKIHAVSGNDKNTTLFFQGGTFEVGTPVEKILNALGFHEAPDSEGT